MARLTQAPMTPRRSNPNSDSFTDLNRLLARMQQSILHADAEREHRLRTSEYERNKAGINLEYARTLLTKLEQDALGVKIHTRRQEVQADLNRKREIFEQLSERLRELEEIAIDSDEEDSDSDGEDLLGSIVTQTPSASDSMASRSPERDRLGKDLEDAGEVDGGGDGMDSWVEDESTVIPEPSQEPAVVTETKLPAPQSTSFSKPEQGTVTAQEVRARGAGVQQPQPNTAETTARTQLFGSRASGTSTTALATKTTEAILDQQREEQDKLTDSLLSMAQTLKSSSQAFQTDLEGEKDILNSASSGMDRNERAMEAASRRMGAIRKMSEGKGWFGRMMLYAWIFGLMVVAVLMVGILPKLRF